MEMCDMNASKEVREPAESLKGEYEDLIAQFERSTQELPPDLRTLRQWRQRVLDLGHRVRTSNIDRKNKLLQKLQRFHVRLRAMRSARDRLRDQRTLIDLSFPSEQLPAPAGDRLGNQRPNLLAEAIRDSYAFEGPARSLASADSVEANHAPDLAPEQTSPAQIATLDIELDPAISGKGAQDSEVPNRRLPEPSLRASNASERRRLSTRTDPIMAIAGRLAKANSFEAARELAGQWLKEKRFPVSTPLESNFEVLQPRKGHRATAVGMPGVWALQTEIADTSVKGRRWRMEMVLVDADPTPAVAITLTVISPAGHNPPDPSVPALVSKLIDEIGLIDTETGDFFSDRPVIVDSPRVLREMLSALQSRRRHRPAIVLSTYTKNGKRTSLLDPVGLAKRLRGIARVYVLATREMTWACTDALSKRFAVGGATVRLFRPAFTPEDDPSRHPIWGPEQLTAQNLNLSELSALFEREAADASLRALEQEDVIPQFDRVRENLLRQQIEEARKQAVPKRAGDELDTDAVKALQSQLANETSLREMFEEDNEKQQQELHRVRAERDRLREEHGAFKSREFYLESRVTELLGRVQDLDERDAHSLPDSWDNLEEWCDENLGEAVTITAKAIRAARDSAFEDVRFCYEVLQFLASTYVPSRLGLLQNGGERLEEDKRRLCIDISPVGREAKAHRSKDTYSTTYKDGRVSLDMHVKGSNDRDPRKCFRLYFNWSEEDRRLIVGWFPSHLDNGMT